MGALRRLLVAATLLAATPAGAEPVDRFAPFIAEAAQRFGVPADWIVRVMHAESGGQTLLGGRPITSPKGAMGLMQIMPRTWTALRTALGLGRDPYDPHDNILAGAYYLRLLHDRFGYPGLFAAYNAGPGRYADYLAGRASLPGETRAYLVTTAGGSGAGAPMKAVAPPPAPTFLVLTPPLFFVRAPAVPALPAAPEPPSPPPAAGLFFAVASGQPRR